MEFRNITVLSLLGTGFYFVDNSRVDTEDKGTIRHHVFTVEEVWKKIDSGEIYSAEAIAGFVKYLRY